MTKKTNLYLSFFGLLMLTAGCNEIDTIPREANQVRSSQERLAALNTSKPTLESFPKNLVLDQAAFTQLQRDITENPAALQKLLNTGLQEAMTDSIEAYKVVWYGDGSDYTAIHAADKQLLWLQTLSYNWLVSSDSTESRRYLDRMTAIIKTWALINICTTARPHESHLLGHYQTYSLIRDYISPEDRTIIDGWIRKRATGPTPNMTTSTTRNDNWEAMRLCFHFYSAYILNDASLLASARTTYTRFLGAWILEEGSTYDYVGRDAVIYHQYGLQFVFKVIDAVRRIEGDVSGQAFYKLKNSKNVGVSDVISFWERFLCGYYHAEFVNSEWAPDRTHSGAPYSNDFRLAYFHDRLDQMVSAAPKRIYPYMRLLIPDGANRFGTMTRYANMLNSADLTNQTSPSATFYKHYNFGETIGTLSVVKGYTKSELETLNFPDNGLSSLKIPAGRKVLLFDEPDFKVAGFQGKPLTLTGDITSLGAKYFNDKTSSLMVVTSDE